MSRSFRPVIGLFGAGARASPPAELLAQDGPLDFTTAWEVQARGFLSFIAAGEDARRSAVLWDSAPYLVQGKTPWRERTAEGNLPSSNEVRSCCAGICALDGGLFAGKDALYGRRGNEQPAADLASVDKPTGRASDNESKPKPLK